MGIVRITFSVSIIVLAICILFWRKDKLRSMNNNFREAKMLLVVSIFIALAATIALIAVYQDRVQQEQEWRSLNFPPAEYQRAQEATRQ
jgi:membrane-anchored protein YejM (alkaline phosphatase superfamily)